jgi:uncharacterized protein YcaQ
VEQLSPDDARRVALWASGLLSLEPTPAVAARASARRQVDIVRGMLATLGAVQLDTISVLARSHELVAYARYGAVRRTAIEDAYWSGDQAFEYWSHAACILPMESWPAFSFRRRHYRAKGERWHRVPHAELDRLRSVIREAGPVTTGDVGGAKRGGEWWDWSDAKIGLEWLLDVGEVVVTRRVGWRRTYDLAERAIPAELFHDDLDDDACAALLVAAGARLMGVGTAGDIADVHRLPKSAVARHAHDVGLVPVSVPGWPAAWATPEALAWLASAGRDRNRTTLLSPFDPLVWYRDRAERIFGMRHRIEAYTPAHKRVHGYFAMPVLHRGRLVARVDPKREGRTLVARRVTFESMSAGAVDGTARARREAAEWVGCDTVEVGEVNPPGMAPALRSAL